jgi:pseudaminic acid cytidylyltransferase
MRPIAIIPARGGSKRIPRKNIYKIDGVPLLGILIEKLFSFQYFEKIYVSTEDVEIADVATKYGAEIPQLRSHTLADDFTNTEKVIKEFLLQNTFIDPESLVYCIYPHSILLEINDILQASSKLIHSDIDFIISAFSVPSNLIRHSFSVQNGLVKILFPQNNFKRSQDLEQIYVDAGLFYGSKAGNWIKEVNEWFNLKSTFVEIPKSRGIDVDTPQDMEELIKMFRKTKNSAY